MMCPKCNAVSGTGKFCSSCGIKLVPLPKCKKCAREVWPHEKYCAGCGVSREEALLSDLPQNDIPKSDSLKKGFWAWIRRSVD